MPGSVQEKNVEVARLLDEIGDLLDLEGGNPFQVRAYKLAARRVRQLDQHVDDALAQGEVPVESPLWRDEIAHTVKELSTRGTSPRLQELLGRLPRGLRELSGVPGLDPKRALALRDALGIRTLDDLEAAARAGRIHEVRGFGEKSERAILRALRQRAAETRRFRLDLARARAIELAAWLEGAGTASQVSSAGELRRQVPTVAGVDLVATALDPLAAVAQLLRHPLVDEVLTRSRTRAGVRLKSGLRLDLYLVKPEARGAALIHHTGSRAHVERLRERARERELELHPYGVFDGEGRRLAGATEEDVYGALGLSYIPPELREGRDEVELAAEGALPTLVEASDICGDVHLVTDPLDEQASAALVDEAARLGLRWAVVVLPRTDDLVGFDEELLHRRLRALEALRARTRLRLLSGLEAEIDRDGRVAAPREALDAVDVVMLSTLTSFDLSRSEQTERLLRAVSSGRATILAHPRGRLLGKSEGMSFDLERVLRAAKAHGVAVEVNAQPDRLDLDGEDCRLAKRIGSPIAIGSEACTADDITHLELGLGQARRGGLTKADVWNALPATNLLALGRR